MVSDGCEWREMSVPSTCRDPQTGKVSIGCFWIRDPDSPNEIEAVKWYLRAAEKGHAGAMANLGWMLANGYGAKQNCNAAQKWLKKAAAAGNESASKNLRVGIGSCRW